MLVGSVGLKFVPVMITVVSIGPEVGVKEVIIGGTGADIVFRRIETVLLPLFVTTMSDLLSPSRSKIKIPMVFVPTWKSALADNEPVVMEPGVLMFLKTETVLLTSFVTAMSGFPSPLMSLIAIWFALHSVAKPTLDAKELVVIVPGVLIFLNIEIEQDPLIV